MDSADLKLGHRVYNKNGKVMAIDLNRQMDIVQRMESPNWPTPDASNHRDGAVLRTDNNLEQGGFHGVSLHHAMTKYGQAAPANPSTNGSRQGLSEENWPTPCANNPNEGETLESWDRRQALNRAKHNNGNGAGTPLAIKVKQWATPQQRDFRSAEGNEHRWENPDRSRNLNDQIKQQATEDWPTVSSAGVTGGPTGLAGGSGNRAKMKRLMGGEMNSKLNPRWVETLMGLPVGWTMPSCASPVTIELTNCASSATESSQQQPSELFECFGRKD